MAGKHLNQSLPRGTGTADFTANMGSEPPLFPGSKVDRAYAEGRQNVKNGNGFAGNPHPTGTDERIAWTNGAFCALDSINFPGTQYETAIGDNTAPP